MKDKRPQVYVFIQDLRIQLLMIQNKINEARKDEYFMSYMHLPPEVDSRIAEAIGWLSGARPK